MSRKKYHITFRRIKELTVEVDAKSQFEARQAAGNLVKGRELMHSHHTMMMHHKNNMMK